MYLSQLHSFFLLSNPKFLMRNIVNSNIIVCIQILVFFHNRSESLKNIVNTKLQIVSSIPKWINLQVVYM